MAEPFKLSYEGGEATEHRVDAAYLGLSLQGSARLYNSVAHFWFYGDIPKRLVPTIRVSAGPPQAGSLMYLIYMLMAHGELAVFPQLLCDLSDRFIPAIVKAIFANRSNRQDQVSAALEVIREMAAQHDEFARTVHKDHIQEKDRMFSLIERLTDTNRTAMAEMVAPVGPSVKQLTHFKDTAEATTVDEPLAEVFRAKEELVVGDQSTYRAKLLAVDKASRTCRVEIDGAEKLVRGKITDPVLAQPGNVYTHSLDTDHYVTITAKPVIRDGEISTLYISNASEAGGFEPPTS